jgi:diaminopimelate epimerase
MTSIPFCKFHGFGNDYIVVGRDNIASIDNLPDLAKTICNRHTGAGADGIAILERSESNDADFTCEIVNPDGSIAGFSGNGTRCAAAYLYYKQIWDTPGLRLKTRSGIKSFQLKEAKPSGHYVFEAEIGKPLFRPAEIPVQIKVASETVIDEPITLDGREYKFSAINVGNPVACIFVDELEADWQAVGETLEKHEVFPERCNIVFVKVIDRENIEIRIWERGAGETAASGTCSAGAAVLSAFLLKTERNVSVHSPGGVSQVLWRSDDEIVLTGRADLAYCGEWPTA